MPVVTVPDAGGQEMTLFQHNGNNYFMVPSTESFVSTHTVPIRNDDVIVCSYPKSGTHWLWEIVWMLATGRLSDDTIVLKDCMLGYVPHEKISSLPSPRVLATHFRLEHLPPDIVKKGCKMIYIIRNPKDVAVSSYNYLLSRPFTNYKGKWKYFLEPFILGKFGYGSWFDHVHNWEAEKKQYSSIAFVHYEDVKENPFREIEQLDKFLGTKRSKEFMSQVRDSVSFLTMHQRKTSNRSYDKSYRIYRKGEVGDWKNWFTVAQNEWFDKLYSERMHMSDTEIRFMI